MSWFSSFVFLIFMATVGVTNMTAQTTIASYKEQQVTALADNMIIYRSYVMAYAAANPSLNSSVADNLLGLPAWFRKDDRVLNHVKNGRGYVYVPSSAQTDLAGLAYQLYRRSGNSVYAGVKVIEIRNPLDLRVAVPVEIPGNAVVYGS